MKKLSGKYITVPLARRIIGMPGHASSKFNRCVGGKLFGTHPGSRQAVRQAFTAAAKSCK
jgi:xanthosine utilization system XapX-like protein